jgi:hypothetical protein
MDTSGTLAAMGTGAMLRREACNAAFGNFTTDRSAVYRRRLRSRQHEFAVAAAAAPKQRPTTYFEFLWSLPARKTPPELLRGSY